MTPDAAPEMGYEVLTISQVAKIVGRSIPTLRNWDRRGILPPELAPEIGNGRIRYWTPAQAEQMRVWIATAGIFPGNNLPGYQPTQARVEEHLDRIRESARVRRTEASTPS